MRTQKPTHKYDLKSLAQYSAFTTAILSSATAFAQVVYSDVDPDKFVEAFGDEMHSGGYWNFDIDGDGINDVAIGANGTYYYFAYDDPYLKTFVMGSVYMQNNMFDFMGQDYGGAICCAGFPYWSGWVSNLNNNNVIGPLQGWSIAGFNGLLYASSFFSSIVTGVTNSDKEGFWGAAEIGDHYIGIRKRTGADYQYGWMRLSTAHTAGIPGDPGSTHYSVAIKDYAFNYTYNDPILAAEGMPCNAPLPIGTFNITPTTAKLKWNEIANSDEYNLFYRQVGIGTWTKKHVTNPFKKITGLACNTSYEWKVRTVCDDENSPFSTIQTFTTSSCKIDGEDPQEELIGYPNPAGAEFTIEYDLPSEINEVSITNLAGQKIENFTYSADMSESLIKVDIRNLRSGIYFITLTTNAGSKNIKFIKQ